MVIVAAGLALSGCAGQAGGGSVEMTPSKDEALERLTIVVEAVKQSSGTDWTQPGPASTVACGSSPTGREWRDIWDGVLAPGASVASIQAVMESSGLDVEVLGPDSSTPDVTGIGVDDGGLQVSVVVRDGGLYLVANSDCFSEA